MSKLSILVSSFDEVKDILFIWHKQHENKNLSFDLFYGLNYLDEKSIRRYGKKFSKKIIYSNTYKWAHSLKEWLSQIDSEYILLLLDDHIIKEFNKKHINIILEDMKKNNINFCQLTYGSDTLLSILHPESFFYGILPKGKYSINLQPSIWEKKTLYETLKNIDTAWDFEIKSSYQFNINKSNIKGIFYLSKNLRFYEQYMERGRYYPERFKKAINKNLHYLLKREKLGKIRRFKSFIGLIYKIIYEFFRSLKHLKKFNI